MACDAEDCGFQMLNDDEIVTSVQKESDPVDDEMDEDEDINTESSKGPSNADAFSALETAMEWYGQQSECYPTQQLLLKRIRDLAAKKRMFIESQNLDMGSGISRYIWDGVLKWEIVSPNYPDQDNGTKLLNYSIVIVPGQGSTISN
ncbi:uncharacterized protein TNCV_170191 [Trichonephila clavipes]|nr:uncharacterized protein TNCV_170191 [Trichonephila clavipes]